MVTISVRTILVYVILNILFKLMGKRQLSELEVGELVATLLISEIASISISDPDLPLMYSVIPIFLIGALEIGISALKNRIGTVKRIVEGHSTYIIFRGQVRTEVLDENRISISELLTEMRLQGFGSIEDIYYAILEQNGKISMFDTEAARRLFHPIITDGMTMDAELSLLKLGDEELCELVARTGARREELAVLEINDDGDIYYIKKERKA